MKNALKSYNFDLTKNKEHDISFIIYVLTKDTYVCKDRTYGINR